MGQTTQPCSRPARAVRRLRECDPHPRLEDFLTRVFPAVRLEVPDVELALAASARQ
jgi:hypothetical protein